MKKNNKSSSAVGSRSIITVLICVSICFALLFSFSSCSASTEKEKPKGEESDAFFSVNGEEITADELDFFRSRLRSRVISDFARRFEINDFSTFWESEFGGESPKEKLETLALEEAAKAKLTLILCRENGIYDEISWSALKEKAEKYNAEHKNGGVGLKSIDMETFYLYYVENGKIELEKYIDGSIEEHIDSLYKSARFETRQS